MANNKDKKILNVPALRFPEFTDEWMPKTINDLEDNRIDNIQYLFGCGFSYSVY